MKTWKFKKNSFSLNFEFSVIDDTLEYDLQKKLNHLVSL